MNPDDLPALLVSYAQIELFERHRHKYHFRDWIMDSGAFSAHNSGTIINLQAYIDYCKHAMENDSTLTEVFSLDVIGDWEASLDNTERMWSQGVPAIPCFHIGEPWDALMGMAACYPKIALGGVVGVNKAKRKAWTEQCFARVWPKKIHGFAYGTPDTIMSFPFHSVDATNWELRPRKFGIYDGFGRGSRIPVRGGCRNLRGEILRYLEMEKEARKKWVKQMAELGHGTIGPTVRLASADGVCFAMSGYETDLYDPKPTSPFFSE